MLDVFTIFLGKRHSLVDAGALLQGVSRSPRLFRPLRTRQVDEVELRVEAGLASDPVFKLLCRLLFHLLQIVEHRCCHHFGCCCGPRNLAPLSLPF